MSTRPVKEALTYLKPSCIEVANHKQSFFTIDIAADDCGFLLSEAAAGGGEDLISSIALAFSLTNL